jgi:hypothetical protein
MAVGGSQLKNRVTCVPEEIRELGYYRILGVGDESMIENMFATVRTARNGQQQKDNMFLSIDCHMFNSQRLAVFLH